MWLNLNWLYARMKGCSMKKWQQWFDAWLEWTFWACAAIFLLLVRIRLCACRRMYLYVCCAFVFVRERLFSNGARVWACVCVCDREWVCVRARVRACVRISACVLLLASDSRRCNTQKELSKVWKFASQSSMSPSSSCSRLTLKNIVLPSTANCSVHFSKMTDCRWCCCCKNFLTDHFGLSETPNQTSALHTQADTYWKLVQSALQDMFAPGDSIQSRWIHNEYVENWPRRMCQHL